MGAHAPSTSGGSVAVGCVLACDADFDIHAVGNYDVLWDALYDNLYDLDPLASIPAGLGLTFAFDGSSSLVVPTEAGIWSLSYFGTATTDVTWLGAFAVGGIGLYGPWPEEVRTGFNNIPRMALTIASPLPAGTQLTHQVVTELDAADAATKCTQVYLSIVRHA